MVCGHCVAPWTRALDGGSVELLCRCAAPAGVAALPTSLICSALVSTRLVMRGNDRKLKAAVRGRLRLVYETGTIIVVAQSSHRCGGATSCRATERSRAGARATDMPPPAAELEQFNTKRLARATFSIHIPKGRLFVQEEVCLRILVQENGCNSNISPILISSAVSAA